MISNVTNISQSFNTRETNCLSCLFIILPLRYLRENAAESKNRFYKHAREFHARKNTRQNNLEDIFNRVVDSSDPIIPSISLKSRLLK